ncbi:MAG TPA: energy transducer TonB [Pyrinomonadaceae bacterium]|jgi:TonB family protein
MKHTTTLLMLLILGFGVSIVSAQKQIKSISGVALNSRAKSLPAPVYPAAAQAVKASGAVNVKVEIDEQGKVISAAAVSGHPLLRRAAEQAAVEAKFNPLLLSGQPVSVSGILVYKFGGSSNKTRKSLRRFRNET